MCYYYLVYVCLNTSIYLFFFFFFSFLLVFTQVVGHLCLFPPMVVFDNYFFPSFSVFKKKNSIFETKKLVLVTQNGQKTKLFSKLNLGRKLKTCKKHCFFFFFFSFQFLHGWLDLYIYFLQWQCLVTVFSLIFCFHFFFLFLKLKNLFGNLKLTENKNCSQNSIYEGN